MSDLAMLLLFPVGFASIWILNCYLLAELSGWRVLALHFRTDIKPEGRVLRGQVYRVGWVPEQAVTKLMVTPQGLYLTPIFLVRPGRRPLLIPWEDLNEVSPYRGLFGGSYRLNVEGVRGIVVGRKAFADMAQYLPPPLDLAGAALDSDWESYRSKRRRAVLMFLGLLPLLAAGSFLGMFFPRLDPLIIVLALSAYWITTGLLILRVLLWRCPRCHEVFSMSGRWFGWTPLTRACVHCGLPKFANEDPNPAG